MNDLIEVAIRLRHGMRVSTANSESCQHIGEAVAVQVPVTSEVKTAMIVRHDLRLLGEVFVLIVIIFLVFLEVLDRCSFDRVPGATTVHREAAVAHMIQTLHMPVRESGDDVLLIRKAKIMILLTIDGERCLLIEDTRSTERDLYQRNEIKEILSEMGLSLGMKLDGFTPPSSPPQPQDTDMDESKGAGPALDDLDGMDDDDDLED